MQPHPCPLCTTVRPSRHPAVTGWLGLVLASSLVIVAEAAGAAGEVHANAKLSEMAVAAVITKRRNRCLIGMALLSL